jgi:heterodisulfide reductase subunit A
MKERIGVYICHCGGNISDYVDVEEIGKLLKDESGVVISRDVMFACADSNQKAMISDIREHKLDAIVVASCSPKLHLHTFRGVADRAGLNPSNYVQVNIREQCSWPHSDMPHEATVKAVGLIRAGIKRVARSESLGNIEVPVSKSVLIVGAGVAGMRAAIDLARVGNAVYLVEKDYFVGGRIAQSTEVFMSGENGKNLVRKLFEEIKTYNNITLFTGATVQKVSGSLGNFSIDVRINPRYINIRADKNALLKAMDDCAENIPDPYNYGLTKRKAIYKNYPEALPDVPVVDAEALKEDRAFLEKHKGVIDLNKEPEVLNLTAGAVLVTTGFDHYQPKDGEFGYNTSPNVVTIHEFRRLMELNPARLVIGDRKVRNIAFIYCVGSRQTKGENKYCSRSCCSAAVYTSILANEKYRDITAFHLFRDIRTYGKQEMLYERSSKLGDVYIRYDEKEPPVVEQEDGGLIVKVRDYLTAKKELEIPADLVVLVTGMVSRIDSIDIAQKFKIPVGNDKFFNEIHPKLKPVETVIKGVYIGGACQGPKNITESVQSSLSASAKINALLRRGTISLDPIIARIDADACVWCGECEKVCEYNAIHQTEAEGKTVAAVNKATCTGCGICAPVCPVNAIEVAQYTDEEIEGMIDGFMEKIELKEKSKEKEHMSEQPALAMKEFPPLWKDIETRLKQKPCTIPELASELDKNRELVTYHVMTMNKYGLVVTDGMDEKELFYMYKMKN